MIPPGLKFLLTSTHVVLPPLVLSFLNYAVPHGYQLPLWLFVPLAILAMPLSFSMDLFVSRMRKANEATRMGAVSPPHVPAKWPGSFDTILDMFRLDSRAYLCKKCSVYPIGCWTSLNYTH